MIKLLAQWENHSGPSAIGDHKIKFSIQKEFAPLLYPHLEELEKNPQLILYIDVVKDQKQIEESDQQKWNRYNKKIHALFDDLAEIKNLSSEDVKKTVKDKLIKQNKIKKSLTELTLDQQIDVMSKLEELIIKERYGQNN